MNDVARYWQALSKHWKEKQGVVLPPFEQLNAMEQMMLVQSINIVLQVIDNHS
jgi:hypothetical protein